MMRPPFGEDTPVDEPDPHGGYIPPEYEPQGFLTPDELDAKFDQWIAMHESDRDDTPDPFGW